MNEEVAFLRAIQERPDDDTARLVYADWLEEQGGEQNAARAAFLRAECKLASLPEEDKGREPLQERLRELAAGIDVVWRATVSKARIEKCPVKFQFKCPKQWDQLQPTDALSERYCETCKQKVHYCASMDEAMDHAVVGHCIAIDAQVVLERQYLNYTLLGRPAVPKRPAWDRPSRRKPRG